MRYTTRMLGICSALIIAGLPATAQDSVDAGWIGVWQGELDGLPSAILTLAKDDGKLDGTLVLNGISRSGGTPHIAVREAHVLMHPKLNGNTLSFDLKRV